MNPPMLRGIAASGLSLFAGVTISYFYALSRGLPLAQAQTFAFAAWIFTLMILAFVSRSEREPLFRLGVLTNKAMDAWALAAFAFLFLVISTPQLSAYFRLSPITATQLVLVLAISFVCASWQEWVKTVRFGLGNRAS